MGAVCVGRVRFCMCGGMRWTERGAGGESGRRRGRSRQGRTGLNRGVGGGCIELQCARHIQQMEQRQELPSARVLLARNCCCQRMQTGCESWLSVAAHAALSAPAINWSPHAMTHVAAGEHQGEARTGNMRPLPTPPRVPISISNMSILSAELRGRGGWVRMCAWGTGVKKMTAQ